MNDTWSTKIQGIDTLNLNREIRFTDKTFDNILNAIGVENSKRIIELGCGPGTFTRILASKYPHVNITGLDFDNNFIEYCNEQAGKLNIENVEYIQGNALETNFEDNYFDVCTSHTVIEHLPNFEFLEEQYRILKPGGKVVVLNTRADFALKSYEKIEPCERETELLSKVGEVLEVLQNQNKIGLHSADPQEILKTMEEVGFRKIQVEAIPYVICLDDDRNSFDYKMQIHESERRSLLEFIKMAINVNPNTLLKNESDELYTVINERFNKRIRMIENGKNMWDISITPTIAMVGRKPFRK